MFGMSGKEWSIPDKGSCIGIVMCLTLTWSMDEEMWRKGSKPVACCLVERGVFDFAILQFIWFREFAITCKVVPI